MERRAWLNNNIPIDKTSDGKNAFDKCQFYDYVQRASFRRGLYFSVQVLAHRPQLCTLQQSVSRAGHDHDPITMMAFTY